MIQTTLRTLKISRYANLAGIKMFLRIQRFALAALLLFAAFECKSEDVLNNPKRGNDLSLDIPDSAILPEQFRRAINQIQSGEFDAADRTLKALSSNANAPSEALAFAQVILNYRRGELTTALTNSADILARNSQAIQVSDFMCLVASDQRGTKEQQIEAMRLSVLCQENCELIPRFDEHAKSCQADLKRVEALIERRMQLLTQNLQVDLTIKNWLANFASEEESEIPIQFDYESQELQTTHHSFSEDGKHIVIYLSESSGMVFKEKLLVSAFFELMNVQNWREFRDLTHAAMRGDVTRDEFVIKCSKLEHRTQLKLRQFYVRVIFPIFTRHEIESDPLKWYLATPGRFAFYQKSMPRNAWYPWQYYGETYDQLVAYGFWAVNDPKEEDNGG